MRHLSSGTDVNGTFIYSQKSTIAVLIGSHFYPVSKMCDMGHLHVRDTHTRCLNNDIAAELDIRVTDFHNQLGRQNWQKERGEAVSGRWELSHKKGGR